MIAERQVQKFETYVTMFQNKLLRVAGDKKMNIVSTVKLKGKSGSPYCTAIGKVK